ncbi:MBL fold metallo-hydrolase [uncultured Adlercreutzia sp.]|uniref:MBL fold metallo-hydrolase n=1 Tax=uncultured Adlercreutzia sp. TaxID=875803 RepID=UPI00351F61D1
MIKLHVLASGSGGNAAIVENGRTGEGVLIDCGICKRDFFERAGEASFDTAKLRAVLITHDHSDHTKGLGVVLRGLAKAGCFPEVLASRAVYATSRPVREAAESVGAPVAHFAGGDGLSVAGLMVRPFRTSHDAAESFGFRFDEEAVEPCGAAGESAVSGGSLDSLGYMTDTGVVTDEAWEALAGVRLLALECNHDARMLQTGPYPYVIKQRIASNVGHLSNDQSREALARLAHDGLRHAVAMHVSQENNTYRLPREVFEAALADDSGIRRFATEVSVAYQNRLVSI